MSRFNDTLTMLENEQDNKIDVNIRLSDLEMLDNGDLLSDEYGVLELGDEAFDGLAKIFKLNKSHLHLLKNEGLTDNVAYQFNHFLQNTSQQKKFRITDNRIRGIVNPNYSGYDDYDLFNSLGEIRDIFPEMTLSSFHREDKRTHARFILEDTDRIIGFDSEEDGNSDIVQVGFDIQNSEIGYGNLRVEPMLYRLVCTNGLRMPMSNGEATNQRHNGKNRFDIGRMLNDSIELSISESSNRINGMQRSKDVKINDVYGEIERIGIKEKIRKDEISDVQEMYHAEPQENMFGVINSFTRYGKVIEEENEDNERRIKFEDIAGRLLEKV